MSSIEQLRRLRDHVLVLSRSYHLKSPLEMPFWTLERRALLVRLEVGMYKLNKTVEIFHCNLQQCQLPSTSQ